MTDPTIAGPGLVSITDEGGETTRAVVRTVALLAGTGAASEAVVGWLDRGVDAGQGRLRRSCLDAGNQVLVSLRATRARTFQVLVRDRDDGRPGVTRMATWAWDGAPRTGWRRLYSGEPAGTWADVAGVVGPDGLDQVMRWHRVLGTNARIYSVAGTDGGPAWVAWQLDPAVVLARALGALGVGDARPAASSVLEAAFGCPLPERGAPWSVALASDGSRWRIGTSRWARCFESDEKRRRLATAMGECGGDRAFAEAVYKVVAASAHGLARVGRAIEVEFALEPKSGTDPIGAEFFLAVPSSFFPAPREAA